MTDHQDPFGRISGIDRAEIETLILVKGVANEELRRVLASKGVQTLEDLDALTAKNFLHYLRSL